MKIKFIAGLAAIFLMGGVAFGLEEEEEEEYPEYPGIAVPQQPLGNNCLSTCGPQHWVDSYGHCHCGGYERDFKEDELCPVNMFLNPDTEECEERASCTSNQTYNSSTNRCEGELADVDLKHFDVTRLEVEKNRFIMQLHRKSGPYPYTLVLDIDQRSVPAVIHRYCTGDAFCNTLSNGKTCAQSNWADWCYNE